MPGFFEIYTQLNIGGEIEKTSEIRIETFNKPKTDDKRLPEAKAEKLKKDLNVVKENILLTNDIMAAGEKPNNETLVQLVNTLEAMESKLVKLVGRLEDAEILQYCLNIKDDLQDTLRKYKDLKDGKVMKIGKIEKIDKNEVDLLSDLPNEPKVVNKPVSDLIFEPIGTNSYINPYFANSNVFDIKIPEISTNFTQSGIVPTDSKKNINSFDDLFIPQTNETKTFPVFNQTSNVSVNASVYPSLNNPQFKNSTENPLNSIDFGLSSLNTSAINPVNPKPFDLGIKPNMPQGPSAAKVFNITDLPPPPFVPISNTNTFNQPINTNIGLGNPGAVYDSKRLKPTSSNAEKKNDFDELFNFKF